ncbi:protein spaetzle 5-like [Pollicipes pollicipes]|uniref:protein spaetzle 5-like n=1 Tax=Pollicipes pollicipes TaxID=41117 RepID=UPI0018851EB9|nr:protein spaetzle 5-like [Pollicipes pollicipes]
MPHPSSSNPRSYQSPFAARARPSPTQPKASRDRPPINFKAAELSANQGSIQRTAGGFLYSAPPSEQQRSQSGYNYDTPSKPVTWEYGFSIARQKRQADSSEGSQLCPTSGQFVTPKAGLNNRGEWRFVVNMEELDVRYTQLVRAERCISDRCLGLCTVPAGMAATCQQQYVQKKMVGLDPSGSQVYTDLYWIPHCCVCQIS